jgi:hypothetical protein
MNYLEKLEIYKRAKRIVLSDLDWKDKYDMIFSDEVSGKFDFDWYNPDTSYEEDLQHFMIGFDEYMKKEYIIYSQIDNE